MLMSQHPSPGTSPRPWWVTSDKNWLLWAGVAVFGPLLILGISLVIVDGPTAGTIFQCVLFGLLLTLVAANLRYRHRRGRSESP